MPRRAGGSRPRQQAAPPALASRRGAAGAGGRAAYEEAVLHTLVRARQALSNPRNWSHDPPQHIEVDWRGLSDSEHVVGFWNDTPGRTHGEVLELFDRAIARQRARADDAHRRRLGR